MGSSGSTSLIRAMGRFEIRTHREMLKEARRPDLVRQYNQDTALRDKLDAAIREAKKYTWPSTLSLNV